MDPDVALTMLRFGVQRAMRVVDGIEPLPTSDEMVRLLDNVATQAAALDGWLSSGGHLPREWRWVDDAPSDGSTVRS